MPRIDDIDDGSSHQERVAFFEAAYERADGDHGQIPWASDDAKPEVLDWLEANPAKPGARALDIACGLGENAEALAKAGYDTVAFDVSGKAIAWAKERYQNSKVAYHQADLFSLPLEWGRFDLVHECYTLQSLPDELREGAYHAIADMVAPGGALLVYARVREDGSEWHQAPWPIQLGEFAKFEARGLRLSHQALFQASGNGGMIPHAFLVYHRDLI